MVRSPKRWGRIVEIAAQHNSQLPPEPDSRALASFLAAQKTADPLRFPEISLPGIKLLGPGEYVVEFPEETAPGHFGLAVKNYTHSTAPNRRFPDLTTQRILKAALDGVMSCQCSHKAASRKSSRTPLVRRKQNLSCPPEDRTQRIAVAAYYRAEQRGFSPGGELEDWLEAEKQIDADLVAESETT